MQLAASPRNRENQSGNMSVRLGNTLLQPRQPLPPGNTPPQDTQNQSGNVQLNFRSRATQLNPPGPGYTPDHNLRPRKRKWDDRE